MGPRPPLATCSPPLATCSPPPGCRAIAPPIRKTS